MTWNTIKTGFLFAVLTGLLLAASVAAGIDPIVAIALAGILNFLVYLFSDRIVLSMTRAKEVSPSEAPKLHRMVESVSSKAAMPKPEIRMVENNTPNAFATGRSPSRAAICVHTGLLNILDEDEIEGVLSHELAHVKHRDTLTMVIAATIAAAITMVGRIFPISSLYGRKKQREGNLLGALLMMVVTPIAAMFVQLGISRTREYAADEGGARLSGRPLALAKALRKIDGSIRQRPMSPAQDNPSISSLYIVNPFKGSTLVGLLSTHPPVNKRVARPAHLAHRARLGQYAER